MYANATALSARFCQFAAASHMNSATVSERLQRRENFLAISALGLVVIAQVSTFNGYLIGLRICGVALGMYLVVDLALVAKVLPNRDTDAAKDIGIFNLARLIPQSVVPAIAPVLLAIGSAVRVGNTRRYLPPLPASRVSAPWRLFDWEP